MAKRSEANANPEAPRVAVLDKIIIKKLNKSAFKVWLIGDSPLIVHAWSQKAKLELLKKHMQQITIREAKDPEDHFLRSIYRMEDGQYGVPVVGIKEAMATTIVDHGEYKSRVYRNIFVAGRQGYQRGAFANILSPMELAELFSPNAPTIREDMVRLSGQLRQPDLRYRAQFWPWAVRLTVSYVEDFIDGESVINLLEESGFRIGLCEWRQEKGGNSGAFHVAQAEELKQCERWASTAQKEPPKIDARAWLAEVMTAKEKPDVQIKTLVAAGPRKSAATRQRATKGNGV